MNYPAKNIINRIFFGASLLFVSAAGIQAQDGEEINQIPDNGPVVTDNSIPESAPLLFDETVPLPDKDSIRIRLKKLSQSTQIPLTYNNAVVSFISYFTVRNREYSKMVLRRKDTYFPVFERILKEYGMPDELKYLSIVESGLNPRARSRADAVGLWQFVPATGASLNLKSDWYIDERQDPEKSTVAACKYLKYLYDRFGQCYTCFFTSTQYFDFFLYRITAE